MNLDYFYAALPLFIRLKLKRILMARLKKKLTSFYAEFVHNNALVFDIGANDGDYTEIFHELGAKVIALEPQPSELTKLKARFNRNKKVVIVPKGVGPKNGKMDFYISSFNNPNSTFSKDFQKKSRYSYRKWDTKISVEVVTINDLIKEYGVPDFCKIDVEGYEFEILSVLKKPLPALSFEFITEMNDKTVKIIKHLETLDRYKYNVCFGMSYRYEFNEWITAKELITNLKKNKNKNLQGDIYIKRAR